MLISPTKCPECSKMKVYPRSVLVTIGGEGYAPIIYHCESCGWESQTPEEAARDQLMK